MKLTITLTHDDGKEVELVKTLGKLDDADVIRSFEAAFTDVQTDLVPFLSDALLLEHQSGVVGEKNQEEKRD